MTPRRWERRGEAVSVVGLKSVLSPFLVTHLTGQCPLWVGNSTIECAGGKGILYIGSIAVLVLRVEG